MMIYNWFKFQVNPVCATADLFQLKNVDNLDKSTGIDWVLDVIVAEISPHHIRWPLTNLAILDTFAQNKIYKNWPKWL